MGGPLTWELGEAIKTHHSIKMNILRNTSQNLGSGERCSGHTRSPETSEQI